MPDQVSAVSDADGRFDLPSVPPDVVCWLRIEHPDHAHVSLFTATTDSPPAMYDEYPVQRLPIEMTLRAVRSVPIEVRHAGSDAVAAGVLVSALQMRATGSHASGVSDEAGRLTLTLPPGEYRLVADPTEGASIRTIQPLVVEEAPAEQPTVLRLAVGCVLVLKAIDADTNAGVPGVDFWFEKDASRWSVQSNTTFIDNPKSNENGELRTIVEPGRRRYGVGFGPLPDGYEVVDTEDVSAGRELDLQHHYRESALVALRREQSP